MGQSCSQSDEVIDEQLKQMQIPPQKMIMNVNDAQKYFIQQGLILLTNKFVMQNNMTLGLNYKITEFETHLQKPPANAAVNIGKNSISFASIFSIQYGENLSKNCFDETSVTFILHDFMPEFPENKPQIKQHISFQNDNASSLRKCVLALCYLIRAHRISNKDYYQTISKKNLKCLKIRAHNISAKLFRESVKQYKIANNDKTNSKILEYCDLLGSFCKFLTKQEYEAWCLENSEVGVLLENNHSDSPFNPKIYDRFPVFQMDTLKEILRDLLYCPEMDVQQALEMLKVVQTYGNLKKFHFCDIDSQNIQMIEQLLHQFNSTKKFKNFSQQEEDEDPVQEMKTLVGGFIDDDNADMDNDILALEKEIELEKQMSNQNSNEQNQEPVQNNIADDDLI